MHNRYAINFHETFSLSRSSIEQVLDAADKIGYVNRDVLSRETLLGTRYQISMPNYAQRSGLLDSNRELTPFGCQVVAHDLSMSQLHTQWLMHYHLSAPHGPGTAFWNHLVVTRFRSGNILTGNEISEQIGAFTREHTGKEIAPRSLRSTATIFLGTYHKSDGLGALDILSKEDKEHCRVLEPFPPSPWTLAYALIDYWHAHYGDRLTINLKTLLAENGFASLFLLGEQPLEQILSELQQDGVLELYRVARPYQVVLLQTDLDFILEKLYQL